MVKTVAQRRKGDAPKQGAGTASRRSALQRQAESQASTQKAKKSEKQTPGVVTIGSDIRDLRKLRGLSLIELAEKAGCSTGHLSQIERGISHPNVKSLHDIASVLGVNVSWFFHNEASADPREARYIVRSKNRRKLTYNSAITDELLSPNLRGELELLYCRFPPGATSGDDPYSHFGEEGGLVLEGRFTLWIDGQRFELEAGDSFGFESTRPHRYANLGSEDVVVIWAITPPSY